MPGIKVELANGQVVVIEKTKPLLPMMLFDPATAWLRFEPIVDDGIANTLFVKGTHVVAMWEVNEDPLYRLIGA